jgi:manganese transport system ATP-binding protein
MKDLRHRQIGELSGGQRKRAFLARALAQEGKVILLDEPFTGVDVKTEKQIIDLLLQLREEGHTILISTHDLASISTFCDRTILINRTILAEGKTAMVLTEENLALTFGGLPLTRTPIVSSSLNHGSFLTSEHSEQDFPLFCNL